MLFPKLTHRSRLVSPVARPRRKTLLIVETLEDRSVPTASAPFGYAAPDYIIHRLDDASPYGSSGPVGLTPTQIRHAYGFDAIVFSGGLVGDGTGQTIAIIDAYDNPKFVNSGSAGFNTSDLHMFDVAFGIADPPNFTKVNQSGGSTMPAGNTGWGGEIALDVEWAHALAPKANILLVEANSASYADLFAAVTYARGVAGVSVVSMSFGGGEFSGETGYDATFSTPAGHQGVTFLASTGDSGQPGGYPAYSPRVVAVGGTHLNLGSGNVWSSETGWSGSGGGISVYESKPSYQSGVTQSSTKRTIPDVAFDADPNSGVAVYDSYANGTSAPWVQVGGTSFSAPAWAALISIANQGRVAAGQGTLDGFSQTLPKIYALPSADFHDITSGSNGYSAAVGYDLVTGRGSPFANLVAPGLLDGGTPPPAGDRFETNNTQATATNLGNVSGTQSWASLSIHNSTDVDWYKFTTVGAGTSANFVKIDFTHSVGDLDMYLYNSAGTQIGSSTGVTNTEQISLNGLAAGSYYVKIIGYNGAVNGNYTLTTNAPTSGGTSSWTYSATDLPKSILDNTTINSTISVPIDIAITKVTVQLNITHTYDSDLYIYLVSPAGRQVVLANRRGGSGDNFTNTIFDSTAATAIGSGAAPFAGTYKPEGLLSMYNTFDAKGTWTLYVQDMATADTGTLNSWSITFTGTQGSGAGPALKQQPAPRHHDLAAALAQLFPGGTPIATQGRGMQATAPSAGAARPATAPSGKLTDRAPVAAYERGQTRRHGADLASSLLGAFNPTLPLGW